MNSLRRIGIFFLFFLCFSATVFALENPAEKATMTIKNFIISKNSSWFADEINIEYKFADKTFDVLKNLSEKVVFKISDSFTNSRPVGNVFIPLEVKEDGKVINKFFLKAKIEVMKNVVIANKYIKKSKILELDDLKIERRDVSLIPQKYFVEDSSLLNKEAKLSIPANSTLFDWMIGDLPLIRRGSAVTIKVVSPGMVVKSQGEALEEGYLGGEIKVKRKMESFSGAKSGAVKILTGKVVSSFEVAVQ